MAGKTVQRAEKSALEIEIVKRAQESLVGFPMGEIDAGADPPDCVIEDSVSGTCCAVEVTETIIKQSREIKAPIIKFLRRAERRYVQENPDRYGGCRISYRPGRAFDGGFDRLNASDKKRLRGDFFAAVDEALKQPSGTALPENDAIKITGIARTDGSCLKFLRAPAAEGITWHDTHYTNERGEDITLNAELLQELIEKKEETYGKEYYGEWPVILLVAAWFFPRGWKRSESFAVRLVHESLVGTRLNTGWFKEVFIHQADHPSYAISCKDGLVREVPNRTADVPGDP